jgi:hypothetical protein
VQLKAAGQVALKLKAPLRDGTMHLVTSPLEFMRRLGILAPMRFCLLRRCGLTCRANDWNLL